MARRQLVCCALLAAVATAIARSAFVQVTSGAKSSCAPRLRSSTAASSVACASAAKAGGGDQGRLPAAWALGWLAAGALVAVAIRPTSSRPHVRCGQRTKLAAAKLHGHPQTRSPLVNWYCYEAEIPLEVVDPLPSPHPFGQVPHLSDDGGVEVFESGAILLYLADKYGGMDSPEARAKYTKWVVWANSTLDQLCFGVKMSGTQIAAPGKAMDRLEEILGQSQWLVDGKFSVADVAVASYLNYVPIFFGSTNLTQRPNIAAYMKRCADRPAFAKAFGDQHASAVKAQVQG